VTLAPELWLATDPPQAALWLVRDGVPQRLDLHADGLIPSGLAWDPGSRTLVVADLTGRLWVLEVADGGGP
jgi:sugar lactone lactonase YvrE